jgi:hypothetical protein
MPAVKNMCPPVGDKYPFCVPGTEYGHLSFFGAWHRIKLETNRQKIYTGKVIYYINLFYIFKIVKSV